MGRPARITPDLFELILEALRLGATETAAAGAVGVSVDSLRRAKKRNASFASSLTRAKAEGRLRLERAVLASDDPKVLLDVLGRRYPEDWARRERHDHHIEVEAYVRQRAAELGVNPEVALERIRPRLRLVS